MRGDFFSEPRSAAMVVYTGPGMADDTEMIRHLAALDRVVEILEQLNLHGRIDVPKAVTVTLAATGLEDTGGLAPRELIPRVLDRQRLLRRRAAMARVDLGPRPI